MRDLIKDKLESMDKKGKFIKFLGTIVKGLNYMLPEQIWRKNYLSAKKSEKVKPLYI